jgi:hypothetical protein
MNPEDTSNAHSLFGDRGVGPASSSSSGGGGGSGGLSLAQQLQYQQLLHQQMQMQQQQHHEQQQQQQQQQSLGIMSSSPGGGVPQQQHERDLALEQYAAARQQAIREAVLSQPYTLNSASLLQQQHPYSQQQQQSQSYNPMVMAQGSGSSLPYSSSSNAMGFLPGLVSQQLPPQLGSNKAEAPTMATGHTSLVQPGHLPQAPSTTVSLSREESMLVEEAVLRGLPLEDVFRAAGMSTLPNRPAPSSASMMMPPPPPSQQASATALARRLSSMEQSQTLGFGGGGGPGRSLGSPHFMSGLDPSHVIAQRELLLSTAAAASNSTSSATLSSSSQHGSDPSWWLPPAKKSRRSSDTLHDALKKHKKKKPPPPPSILTASTPSGLPTDSKSLAVSKTTIEAASRLPGLPALASALPSLRGCSFPVPPRLSGSSSGDKAGPAGSTTRTKKPPAQPSKLDDDNSSSSGDDSAASEDLGRKAGWSVGSLSSFRALWDELDHVGTSRTSKRRSESQELPLQHQQIQREVFRRTVGAGSVPVDPADSRSAVALYDRLRRREQEQQQQAQHMQQRELEEHRLLLLQLRSRGL